MVIAQFWELPVGARFCFRERRYEKIALSMARDEDRCGNVFHDETEVAWDRRPGEEARPRRPPKPHWTSYLTPAPGEVQMQGAEGRMKLESNHR